MINFYKGKNIIVTGASGFVGKNLVTKLKNFDCNVIAFNGRKIFNFVDGAYKYFIKDNEQIDCVFHCAAVSHGAKVMKESPESLVTDNIIMNSRLLDACYKAKVKKFLFISSNTVYQESLYPIDELALDLGQEPSDCYFGVAWVKRYTEKLCEFYSAYVKNPMGTVIVRPVNLYGPHDDFNPETSHVTAALIRKYIDKQNPLEIWGDGKDQKEFLYIDDFIEGLLLAMAIPGIFDVFNMGTEDVKSILELADIIKYEASHYPAIKLNSDKPSMIPYRALDSSKAKRILGWEAKISLREGINKTVKWYLENK